jgi:hypothetical protein
MTTGRFFGLVSIVATAALQAVAQSTLAAEKDLVDAGGGNRALYWTIFIALASLGAAYFFWRRSRGHIQEPESENRYRNYYQTPEPEMEQVDAEQELEWLRQAKKKPAALKYGPKRADSLRSKTSQPNDLNFDTKVFQEKMKMLQYVQLPINSFSELSPAKKFEPLPLSNDKSLLSAIEQANEEYEEDEAVRELAVRILAAFRTRNSIEALSQMALYDLSSNLRSKSVAILTDFDHESVFETILLACADPTREVRAAAARGLFRLNFDRADAWKRLIESGDGFRMSHAVRAAVEAGIVQKSFDRLVHEDLKIAYEAFTLVALMIKAGETKEIFSTIREHKDERVKFALLHVIKSTGDGRTLMGLSELLVVDQFTDDVVNRINDILKSFERVAV